MRQFWRNSDGILERIRSAPRLLVTLDFDGTLAALAETPGKARLRPEFKSALRSLASLGGVSVFILSGRALKSVRGLVGLKNLYYGGNHGIEIEGPGFSWRDGRAVRMRDSVAAVASDLKERFPPGTGVLVENKTFSASVHYRNIKRPYRHGFFSRMKALLSSCGDALFWRPGRKVFELLPRGASHKGNALDRLAESLGDPLGVAVGDDLTDEDMFRALAKSGITVRVGRKPGSKAGFFLSRQAEVLRLLRSIICARRGDGNGKKSRRTVQIPHSAHARGGHGAKGVQHRRTARRH